MARKVFQFRRKNKRNTWGAGSVAPYAPGLTPVEEKAPVYPPPATRQYGSTDYNYNNTGYGAPAPVPTYNTNTYGSSYAQYPAANPGYNNNLGAPTFSPAAASSAGYSAPYPYNNNNAGYGAGAAAGAMGGAAAFNNKAAYNSADLAGATPIVSVTSPPSQISVVRRTFAPTLPDELSISTGESVRVLSVFDDGWCKVQRLGTNEMGVVPFECLEGQGQGGSGAGGLMVQDTRSKRASSLYEQSNAPRY